MYELYLLYVKHCEILMLNVFYIIFQRTE